jgi:hypothetical protein
MKNKPLFILFALVIIIGILSFLWDQQKVKKALVKGSSREGAGIMRTEDLPEFRPISSQLLRKRAITVIKKAPKEREIPTAKDDDRKTQLEAAMNRQHSQATAAASGSSESEAKEGTAGITRVNNRPSPEQIKELNSKGIIIY